eukprot:m.73457 g.73457  ORF g.73457 m.73457 type:complete len:119 (+) comp10226_c0_seq1:179-535(+)
MTPSSRFVVHHLLKLHPTQPTTRGAASDPTITLTLLCLMPLLHAPHTRYIWLVCGNHPRNIWKRLSDSTEHSGIEVGMSTLDEYCDTRRMNPEMSPLPPPLDPFEAMTALAIVCWPWR